MRRTKKKDLVQKYAVLFGFNVGNEDDTGYVRLGPDGRSVVKDVSLATEFPLQAEPGRGTPEGWCEFLKSEPGFSDWRFHPVIMTKQIS